MLSKEILNIALKYSLMFSLFVLIEMLFGLIFNNGNRFILPFPLQILYFIFILFLSHRKYIKEQKNAFKGILLLSLLFIFFSYCFEYLINLIYYYLSDNNTNEGTGIQALIDGIGTQKPIFKPLKDLILLPIEVFGFYIKALDFYHLAISLFSSKILVSLIFIYYESLFYLFKQFNKRGIDAILPIQNNINLLAISNKPVWWIFLLYIPLIRKIVLFLMNDTIAKKFGKTYLFSIGMTLLPPFFYGELALNHIDKKA